MLTHYSPLMLTHYSPLTGLTAICHAWSQAESKSLFAFIAVLLQACGCVGARARERGIIFCLFETCSLPHFPWPPPFFAELLALAFNRAVLETLCSLLTLQVKQKNKSSVGWAQSKALFRGTPSHFWCVYCYFFLTKSWIKSFSKILSLRHSTSGGRGFSITVYIIGSDHSYWFSYWTREGGGNRRSNSKKTAPLEEGFRRMTRIVQLSECSIRVIVQMGREWLTVSIGHHAPPPEQSILQKKQQTVATPLKQSCFSLGCVTDWLSPYLLSIVCHQLIWQTRWTW